MLRESLLKQLGNGAFKPKNLNVKGWKGIVIVSEKLARNECKRKKQNTKIEKLICI